MLVVLGIIFAAPITHAITPKFGETPGKLELTTLLTRIMLPFLPTVAVAVAMMGMLNSLRRFFIPALSPAMFNVATIACAFALVPLMPAVGLPPIAGIAIGALLGGLGQIAIQWPVLKREGFRYQPVLDFKDPDLREVLRLIGPGTLGLAAVQINVLVNTYLASSQPTGSRLLAQLRLPADVPADRPLRRLDRDRGAPRDRAPCRRRPTCPRFAGRCRARSG